MIENFDGTMPVAERQKFDEVALQTWLHANVDGFSGPLTVEQFKGGQSNPTFKLVSPQQCYVMRTKPGQWRNCCLRRTRSSASSA